MHGRGQDPLRKRYSVHGAKRAKEVAACSELLDEIEVVDEQLALWAAHRHRLVAKLQERREVILPKLIKVSGRRVMEDGNVCLAPVPDDVPALWGRRLRASCMRLLAASGTLTLTELHVLLHQHGLRIDSAHPVKALADAMAYECEQGRARRLGRAVYTATATRLRPPPQPDARRPAPTHDPDSDPDPEPNAAESRDDLAAGEHHTGNCGGPGEATDTPVEETPQAAVPSGPPVPDPAGATVFPLNAGKRLIRLQPDEIFDRLEQLADAILPRAA